MRIADPYPPSVETGHLDPAAQPPRIGAVLFDFAHTTFRPIDTGEWLRRAAEIAGQPLDENTITRLVGRLDEAWSLPEVTRAQVGRDVSVDAHRRAALTWIHAVPELTPLGGVLYEVLTATDSWLPYPDTGPVLAELARHHIPVGVVSDIAWDIREHFIAYGMHELVGTFALSYEHGLEKPDPRLFGHACAELGVDPRAALMVGDSPARDGGAIGAGLRAYILPAERRVGVRGLADVLGLLGLQAPPNTTVATTGVKTTGQDMAADANVGGGLGPPPPTPRSGPIPHQTPATHADVEPPGYGADPTETDMDDSDGHTTMEFTVGPMDDPQDDLGFGPGPGLGPGVGAGPGQAGHAPADALGYPPLGMPAHPGPPQQSDPLQVPTQQFAPQTHGMPHPGPPTHQRPGPAPYPEVPPQHLGPAGAMPRANVSGHHRVNGQSFPGGPTVMAATQAPHPNTGLGLGAGIAATATVPMATPGIPRPTQAPGAPVNGPASGPAGGQATSAAPAPQSATSQNLRMRHVESADHGAILTGIAAGWSGPTGFGAPDPWLLLPRMLLETTVSSSLVVTADEELRGYLIGVLPGQLGGDGYAHLLGVAPGPDATRIAKAMLDRFADIALAANLARVRLAVPPGDMALLGHCLAARFAIQPGTATVADTPVTLDYDGPGQHRVVLVRQLTVSAGGRGGRHRGG